MVVVDNVRQKGDDELLITLYCLPKYLWREPLTAEHCQKFHFFVFVFMRESCNRQSLITDEKGAMGYLNSKAYGTLFSRELV